MANHRMVSNRVANSAKFLQMPAEAQLLYFHLVLRADDDGVVESYPIMKLLGTPLDNFKILQVKKLIEQINEDQVVIINDWIEHNTIRSDRKVNSIYLPFILEKKPNFKFVVPTKRADVKDNSRRLDNIDKVFRLGGQSTDGLSKGKLSKDINTSSKDDSKYKEPTPEERERVKNKLNSLNKDITSKLKI